MESIKKSNLFATSIVLLFTFCIVGFWGCESDQEDSAQEFLDIKTYDMSKMTETDFKTIIKAMERLDVSRKDGLYVVKETSGNQVNISNQLFDFVKQSFSRTNKLLKGRKLKNIIARINSGNPEDCVAHAIAGLNAGVSYAQADAYITSLYGSNGVPPNALISVVQHFFPQLQFSTSPPSSGQMNNKIVIMA